MSVTYDNSTNSVTVSGSATRTLSHTTNAASNSAIMVCVECKDGVTWNVPTVDGVAMTLIASLDNGSTDSCRVFLYGLCGQAAGTNTVQVTGLSDTTVTLMIAAVSVNGADQTGGTTTFRNGATANGVTSTPSQGVATAADEFVVQGVGNGGTSTPTIGATGTQRWNNAGGSSKRAFGATAPGTGGTVTISWTGASTSCNIGWITTMATIKAGGRTPRNPAAMHAATTVLCKAHDLARKWKRHGRSGIFVPDHITV